MKKILSLLILVPLMAISQSVPADATALENLQITNNTTDQTATKVNVQNANGVINTIPKADLINVIESENVASLPLVGQASKLYVVKNVNKLYRWNGTFYAELTSGILDPAILNGKVDKVVGKSLISDTEITRLAGVTNYTHPANHPASIITQDADNRFVTDIEKSNWNAKQNAIGYTAENIANKVTTIGLEASNTKYPTELAVKAYADGLLVGLLNDRGSWDASTNLFPTTGGSGVSGAIKKGDMWYVSVDGLLADKAVNKGDSFRALVNNPGQVATSWAVLEGNLGYVPANDDNVAHLTGDETIAGTKTFNEALIINKINTIENVSQTYELLKDGEDNVVVRLNHQIYSPYQNGLKDSYNGLFLGTYAGQDNTGGDIGGISGFYAGSNNSGSDIGVISGTYAGQDNTGGDIGGISGTYAGSNNSGSSIGDISGTYAGQDNSGSDIGVISGSYAGSNNSGSSIGDISGTYAGQDNTGSNIGVISGSYAGSNNSGSNIGVISGSYAGQDNTGGDIGGISGTYAGSNNSGSSIGDISGTYAGSNNSGSSIGGISGSYAGQDNTGSDIGVISGSYAGSNNSGSDIGVISGYGAGSNNSGSNIGVISGSYAGQDNTGGDIGVISGYGAGSNNSGSNIGVISGTYAGSNNTGSDIGALIGKKVGYYNEGSNNIIGDNSHSLFNPNISGAKTSTAVDVATKRITITAHGFGSNNSYTNVRYTTSGTAIGGLTNNNIYQVQIINANTILFNININNITSEGTGTHTFTPQFKYDNVNILGNNVQPTASNQTIIGTPSTTQFIGYGRHLVGTTTDNGVDALQVNGTASASPATASNHLVTKAQLDLKVSANNANLTGVPTAPTAAAGTNTTQIATTAFVTSADSGNVKLTGDQNISGLKTFTNSSNSSGIYSYNTSTGDGIYSENIAGGVGLHLNNFSGGNNIVSNNSATGTGFNYVGQNQDINTFTVDKLGATTANSFIKTGGTASQFLKADGSVDESDVVKNIAKEASQGSNVTGTVSETILYSKLIPANTFKDGDFMTLFSRVQKNGGNGVLFQRVRINTSNTLTGSVQIASNLTTAINQLAAIERTYTLDNGLIIGASFNFNYNSDISNTTALSTFNFNPSIDNYIFITGQLGSALDTMNHIATKITN